MDLVARYVRFIFAEYEKDPRGWITKNPPSVAEFEMAEFGLYEFERSPDDGR